MTQYSTRLRERHWFVGRLLCLALAMLAITVAIPRQLAAQGANVIVVQSDRGGYIGQRNAEIRTLRASGTRVELQGLCLSACTMYLSLPNACVSPSAVFGFHGPSRNGQPLSARDFDHWSQIMASGYREPLRSWYMSQARYTLSGYHQLSGTDLIRMGYPPC